MCYLVALSYTPQSHPFHSGHNQKPSSLRKPLSSAVWAPLAGSLCNQCHAGMEDWWWEEGEGQKEGKCGRENEGG